MSARDQRGTRGSSADQGCSFRFSFRFRFRFRFGFRFRLRFGFRIRFRFGFGFRFSLAHVVDERQQLRLMAREHVVRCDVPEEVAADCAVGG